MKEIETLEEFDAHLATGEGLTGVALQGLDLSGRWAELADREVRGAVLLGCTLSPTDQADALTRGALVFPELPDLPFRCFRSALYTVDELYAGFEPEDPTSYAGTLDARVYARWKETGGASPASVVESLARRLHDHGITDALEELLGGEDPPRVVAVMGGHSMLRGAAEYNRVAALSRTLARRGFLVATGGGPGAMEAANLGAYLAGREDGVLAAACGILAEAPRYDDERWLSAGFRVRQHWPPEPGDPVSLGIPTWLYGHEPPNPFAGVHAKYFANAVREEGLLSVARHGVVFSPGSAGTIQEIFQDACQNHYKSVGVESPMVFLDRVYWTEVKPVFPLLETLAKGRDYSRWLGITDDPEEAVALLEEYAAEGPLSGSG